MNLLFTLRMKIRALNRPTNLIKSNIIKPLKTRPCNCPNPMIRHQKVFFPSHEYYPLLSWIRHCDFSGGLHGRFVMLLPALEKFPVVEVGLATGAPVGVFGEEGVF